jgi:hypothetical protein
MGQWIYGLWILMFMIMGIINIREDEGEEESIFVRVTL